MKRVLRLVLLSLTLAALSGQDFIPHLRRAGGAASLDNTSLVVRYPINESDDSDCLGTDATQITDSSANAYHLNVIDYSTTMSFAQDGTNCHLATTSVSGTHHAYKVVSNTSDAIRDLSGASTGTQKITVEFVADVDSCSSSNGRIFAINSGTQNPDLGVTCASTSDFRVYWNESVVETFSETSGARKYYAVVYDTTQATAADRIKVYVDGTLKADGGTPMAQNSRLNFGSLRELLFLNRGVGSWQRSITTKLYHAAILNTAFTQSQVTNNANVFATNDD